MSYLVKWVGYSDAERTWEPEEHLSCPEVLAAFNSRCANYGIKKVSVCADGSVGTERSHPRSGRRPTSHGTQRRVRCEDEDGVEIVPNTSAADGAKDDSVDALGEDLASAYVPGEDGGVAAHDEGSDEGTEAGGSDEGTEARGSDEGTEANGAAVPGESVAPAEVAAGAADPLTQEGISDDEPSSLEGDAEDEEDDLPEPSEPRDDGVLPATGRPADVNAELTDSAVPSDQLLEAPSYTSPEPAQITPTTLGDRTRPILRREGDDEDVDDGVAVEPVATTARSASPGPPVSTRPDAIVISSDEDEEPVAAASIESGSSSSAAAPRFPSWTWRPSSGRVHRRRCTSPYGSDSCTVRAFTDPVLRRPPTASSSTMQGQHGALRQPPTAATSIQQDRHGPLRQRRTASTSTQLLRDRHGPLRRPPTASTSTLQDRHGPLRRLRAASTSALLLQDRHGPLRRHRQ